MSARFPALQSREFRIFLSGQLISLIGTWMQSTVQPYLAYRLTGDPWMLGVVAFANALPTLIFTLPAGVLVERANRRKVVMVMQGVMLAQALILAVLALTHMIEVWHLVVLAFVLGAANSIEIPARQSMLYELVGREGLANAIGLQSAAFNMARVIGPSLAAPFLVLLGDDGEGWAFLFNAVTFLFVLASLFTIRPKFIAPPRPRSGSVWTDLRAGQRYVLGSPLHLALMLGIAGFSIAGFPNASQVPTFAHDVLGQIGDTTADIAGRNSAMLTFQGLGALVASFMLTTGGDSKRKGWRLIAGQVGAGLALITLAQSRLPWLSYAAMALFGWGTVLAWATTNTVIQLVTPTEYRSRVIATMLWAGNGFMPLGSLIVGALAQRYGAPLPALLGGIFCMALPLVINLATPRVRNVQA